MKPNRMAGLIKKILTVAVFAGISIFSNSCKTPSVIATQTIQRADEYNNQRKYSEAISFYKKYLNISPTLGLYRNPSMEADVCRKLAYAYSTRAKYDSSLFFLKQALKIDSVIPQNALEVIEDYRKIGITYGYIGDYNKSIQFLNKSLEMNAGMEKSQKEIKRLSIGDTYLSLAQVHFVRGEFQDAELKVGQAIEIYKKTDKEYLGLLESYLLLGKLKIEQGEIKKGLELIESSIKIAEKNNLNTAMQHQAIGSTYLASSDYENALKSRLEALKQAKESKIVPQISWMNVKVGDVYSYLGDAKKAQSYYETALLYQNTNKEQESAISSSLQMRLGDVQGAYNTFMKMGSLNSAGMASLRLGEISVNENQFEKAENYINKADSIFTSIGSVEGKANSKMALCRLYIDQNKISTAWDVLKQINIPSYNQELKWQMLYEKGRIFEKQQKTDSAYHYYSRAIDVIEKIRGQLSIEEFRSAFMKDKMHVYESIIMLLIEHDNGKAFKEMKQLPVVTAYYFSERARSRSFLDIIGNVKINSKKSSDSTLLNKEQRLRIQIQKVSKEIQQSAFGLNDTEEQEKYLDFLNKEYAKTVDMVKLSNSDYQSVLSVEPPKLSEIQGLIDDKSAILEYWIGANKMIVWLISNKNIVAKLVNIDEKEISSAVTNCRSMIQPYTSKDYEKALADLYDYLVYPLEKELFKFESLTIVPHRNLHFLPFQALMDKNGKYLVESFNISYAPSSAVLKHCKSKVQKSGNSFLGMALGDVALEQFSALPGTKIEINQIIQLYPGAIAKYENETSESYFKNEAKNFSILHVATHGFLDTKRPMDSYLLMLSDQENDGQLSVNEIFELNLQSKLVVLSACETGLGRLSKGDELVGLSRAFIYAGTPAIIVSLWPVDDASTALLMTRLHQYYAAGYKLQESLSFAQRDLIKNNFNTTVKRGAANVVWDNALEFEIKSGNKSKKRNPFFWAPFILIGFGG